MLGLRTFVEVEDEIVGCKREGKKIKHAIKKALKTLGKDYICSGPKRIYSGLYGLVAIDIPHEREYFRRHPEQGEWIYTLKDMHDYVIASIHYQPVTKEIYVRSTINSPLRGRILKLEEEIQKRVNRKFWIARIEEKIM